MPLTWQLAAAALEDLNASIPARDLQAATGLPATCVLLVAMNWFLHKLY